MEISKKPWPILSVCGIKSSIDTNPDFQRPADWSRSQKQLLIDTILRGYDISKHYWRKTDSKPEKYDVVDGQQRLRTILEFRLRAKGTAPRQPRAAPWVSGRKNPQSPKWATQRIRRRPMGRPFRAQPGALPKPRALPWAGMFRTVGAEESQRDFLTHLHATLNAPTSPARNRLLRLTADSPDLLAIIKAEGKV